MASPESRLPTPDLPPYWHAARFANEVTSRRAYMELTTSLCAHHPVDLSVTRLLLERGYHVVVVGPDPGAQITRVITHTLTSGHVAELSRLVLIELWERHRSSPAFSPWMERCVRR